MMFARAFLLLALVAVVRADDADDFEADVAATEDVEVSEVPATEYAVPDTAGLDYIETFQTDMFAAGRWTKSADSAYAGQSVSTKAAEDPAPSFAADLGMHLDLPATKYGVVSEISPAVQTTGEDLIIQYELRLQNGLECGGAYLKLLTDDADISKFDSNSPYSIMFGPDKCGGTNKVHFIYKHRNPITGEWEEKHAVSPPSTKVDGHLHLYTLIVRKDLTYEIRIDGKSEKHGSLDSSTDFSPALLPSAEIDDPTDKKPADWVDEAKIADPLATKPEDWDEDAPKEVDDMDAAKPAGWLDDEPADIADPGAEMPEDWDEDEDGEWEAPQVPNPKCVAGPGCGAWERPSKTNPEFKGKWTAPFIENPAYKGVWAPAKIAHPGFFDADHAGAKAPLAPIGAVAIEIWTMQAGIHFDNILVSNNVAAAEAFTEQTFGVKSAQEAKRASTKAVRDAKRTRLAAYERGGLGGYATYYTGEGAHLVKENMIAFIVTIVLLLGAMIKFCCMGDDDYEEEGYRQHKEEEKDGKVYEEEDEKENKIQEVVEEEEEEEVVPKKKPGKRASKSKKSKKVD